MISEKEAQVSRLKLELCNLNEKIAQFEGIEVDKVAEENQKLKNYANGKKFKDKTDQN